MSWLLYCMWMRIACINWFLVRKCNENFLRSYRNLFNFILANLNIYCWSYWIFQQWICAVYVYSAHTEIKWVVKVSMVKYIWDIKALSSCTYVFMWETLTDWWKAEISAVSYFDITWQKARIHLSGCACLYNMSEHHENDTVLWKGENDLWEAAALCVCI